MEVVLGAGGQDERDRTGVGNLGGSPYPLYGTGGVINRVVLAPREVLDGASGQTLRDGGGDGGGHAVGIVGEAVLEIGRDRHLDGGHELGTVGQHLVSGDGAIEAALGRGEPTARRGDRLAAERGEEPGGTLVPRVGQEEGGTGAVERQKAPGPFGCLVGW